MIENIPPGALKIIKTLEEAGYEAYVVGGCVRDSLLGIEPHDWDICTNAKPEEIKQVFSDCKIIETGLKHGTVTVGIGDLLYEFYEVTTYRVDGEYSDHRRPDTVEFVSDLQQDLARRDFTINAMAFSPRDGLRDPFCGQLDLMNKTICCVGNPNDRFKEDALRIMRALRFSAHYGFAFETHTLDAMYGNMELLDFIAKERIKDELCKLLTGEHSGEILFLHPRIIEKIIPEIGPCIGFAQNNPYHIYDVYGHTAKAVGSYTGDDIIIKLALLLHDIGKPQCYTEDENGGHFKGHGKVSREIAEKVMDRLRFDNETKRNVLQLVEYHDSEFAPSKKTVRRFLNKIGEEQLRRLIEVRKADVNAHSMQTRAPLLRKAEEFNEILNEVIAEGDCFTVKDLHIDGNDIMNMGLTQGKEVGQILSWLLNEVIEGRLPNKHHDLKMAAEFKIYGIE